MVYPLIKTIPLSLTDSEGGPTAENVGLANYRAMLDDATLLSALGNTLVFTVVVVLAQSAIGLALAAMLRRWGGYGKALAVVLLTPALLSSLMASYIWSSLYQQDGAINSVLNAIGLGSLRQVWLAEPSTALYAIAVVHVWMSAGLAASIFAAGFRTIPEDMLEAARLDGANRWQVFWKVEWPMLAPSLTVAITLSLLGCLRVLELPLVMAKGGPANATNTLGLQIYRTVFANGEVGYGTALSVLLLAVVTILVTAANALLRRREGRLL
ncbi:sugar ABC transporter permease [Solihabitans fulvus]|uniref:Sugar ABC transporter permease n=2 Tax=Solihabitans fulvus TaxID=1892852 RepID=A0A5B2XCG9_9PSEU|nr:sugar ABC transporter permease [Solihabitans fulvus]